MLDIIYFFLFGYKSIQELVVLAIYSLLGSLGESPSLQDCGVVAGILLIIHTLAWFLMAIEYYLYLKLSGPGETVRAERVEFFTRRISLAVLVLTFLTILRIENGWSCFTETFLGGSVVIVSIIYFGCRVLYQFIASVDRALEKEKNDD